MESAGTIRLVGSYWEIHARPDVAIRVRRLFPRAQSGTIRLLATPEVSRDLEWLCERYSFSVEPLGELERRSAIHREAEVTTARVLAGELGERIELALPPRDYQAQAARLAQATGGTLCGDDVGLGKTVTSICMLVDPRARPALVVTLTHLPTQWAREIERFAPSLSVFVVKGGEPHSLAGKGRDGGVPDVIIINYHKLARWADHLAGVVRGIVFDEVQELRHHDSNKYCAAQLIADKALIRMGLSATPIYNYGGEIHSVLDILRPGALGTREEFWREWCVEGGRKARLRDPKAFGTYLRTNGLMIRRTRADVARELPPLTTIVHEAESDKRVMREAFVSAAAFARALLSRETAFEERGRAARELDWRLRLATGRAKAEYVAAFVRLLLEAGESVVLFGWHREVYAKWLEILKDFNPLLYTGSESIPQKNAARDAFLGGETKLLIMSLRAGAGLDGLQAVCSTVVFGELDWSPGVHEQCTGRIFRDGQALPVMAYYLVSDDGSDPVLVDVLGVKTQQIASLRDPDAEQVLETRGRDDALREIARRFVQVVDSPDDSPRSAVEEGAG